MADAKISALITGGAAQSGDLIPIARIVPSDQNYSITVGAIATYVLGLVPPPPPPGGITGAVQFNNAGVFAGTAVNTAGVLISGTTLQLFGGLGDSTGTFATPKTGADGEFLSSIGSATKWRWIPFYDVNGNVATGNDDHIASGTAQLSGDLGSPSYINSVVVTLTSDSMFADTNYVVQVTRDVAFGQTYKIAGSVTSGVFEPFEIVGQTSSGATATLNGPIPSSGAAQMYIFDLSGNPDAVHTWVGSNSGSVFTPANPSKPTITAAYAAFNTFSAANASGSTTVYTGFSPTGNESADAYIGYTFVVTGFTNAGNNGTFLCVASTDTTLTLANPNGVAENSPYNYIINGTVQAPTGSFISGEGVIQNVSGASATLLIDPPYHVPTNLFGGNTIMYMGLVTGTPNAGSDWVGQSSGKHYTPSGKPASMVCSAVMFPVASNLFVKVNSASQFTIYSDNPADRSALYWTAIGYGVPGGSP